MLLNAVGSVMPLTVALLSPLKTTKSAAIWLWYAREFVSSKGSGDVWFRYSRTLALSKTVRVVSSAANSEVPPVATIWGNSVEWTTPRVCPQATSWIIAVSLKPMRPNWPTKVERESCGRGVLVESPVPPAVASILPVLNETTGPPHDRTDAYTPKAKRSAIDDREVRNGDMLMMVSLKPWPMLLVAPPSSKMSEASSPPVPICTQAVAMSWKAVRSHSAELARPGVSKVVKPQGWTNVMKFCEFRNIRSSK